jgi:hypothetical protein
MRRRISVRLGVEPASRTLPPNRGFGVVERLRLYRWGVVLAVALVATTISVGPGLAGDTGNATRPIEKATTTAGSTQGKKVIER